MNKAKVKRIVIADKIYINKEDIEDLSHLESLYTYNTGEEFISTINIYDEYVTVPSNSYYKLDWDEIEDKRNYSKLPYQLEFHGKLRYEQQEAVDKLFIQDRARSGLLQAPPGYGKTFTACNLLARNNTRTLILTHTKLLFEQWLKELEIQLPSASIGKIGDGQYKLGDVTVAIYKTAYNNIDSIKDEFSTLIVDECLDYESTITTKTGKVKLGKIVNNKLTPEVLTYNTDKGIFEYKKVYNWFKNKQEVLTAIGNKGHLVKGTDNHNVYVYQNESIIKKPIKDILVGDYLVGSKNNYSSCVLKKEVLPIVLGLIIGDGSIRKHSNQDNIRISITHGEKQKEYLEYKANIIAGLFSSSTTKSKSGYCENSIYSKHSCSIVDNYNLYKSLYKNSTHKNYISPEIIPYINEATWAFIYQDDGSISKKQITISVCELDIESCNLLVESLKQLFNLDDPWVGTYKGYKYIRLKSKDSLKFQKAIAKYVHPSLRYKLDESITTAFEPIRIVDFCEPYSLQKVMYKYTVAATNGYRYNISVEDNHNYIANNVLVGNCHKCPADMFSSVVNNINAKVKIGLSATPRRKDGKHVFLNDFFSKHIVIAKDSRTLAVPSVQIIRTDFSFKLINPKADWARALNKLCSDEAYLRFIAEKAIAYIKQGRCPLIIGERVQMLKDLEQLIPSSICVIGSTPEATRKDAIDNAGIKYSALLSTKLFDEGISCHRLDTLILTCPSNNSVQWEQRIGRIERLHPDKKHPLIVDFWLSGAIVNRQQNNRAIWYQQRGYNIL